MRRLVPDLAAAIQQGSQNLWLFIPTAILLGALHGLEPGHSKTMMAAFIIAVRGTIAQAVLLGLAATASHTAIVWLIALAGLHFGSQFNTEATEPYLQLVSAVLIIGVALWMAWWTWREQSYHHDHDHHHHDERRVIDTGHGNVALSVFEEGVPPRWRVEFLGGERFAADAVTVTTVRPDRSEQQFAFHEVGGVIESVETIPEPHEFEARLALHHAGHPHTYRTSFAEHGHSHEGLDLGLDDRANAHERAHADAIKRRFSDQNVTTSQIILFGLTGGLIPCPASITVLLLCLQLKQFTLGAGLVLCFSIGLAITMVTVGVAAAYSVHQVSKRWSGFTTFTRRTPYFSSALIVVIGLYTAYLGWSGLSGHG
jgi:nickel/cobalt transporter (NicO) family protein